VVGAGDSELAELHMPAISVQHWDQGEVGAAAASLLLNRIREVARDEPQHVLVQSEFIERASMAAPRQRGSL
jgi:LacI family transcriptional regulator